jgi:hypothetical protein
LTCWFWAKEKAASLMSAELTALTSIGVLFTHQKARFNKVSFLVSMNLSMTALKLDGLNLW